MTEDKKELVSGSKKASVIAPVRIFKASNFRMFGGPLIGLIV
ncbi:MAG: hypothetical protein RL600_360, partial [Actinomycetota bacterium]